MTNQNALISLTQAGVSVWLDDLSRGRITSGDLSRLVHEVGVRGVTTNPAIFANAVRSGAEYQSQLTATSLSADEAIHELMVRDVKDACTIFSPVFEASDGVDGRVSLEVDPRLAFDADATVAAAAAAWRDVDRPNAMIKIPATRAGLPAISATLATGISVNVTLIFSLQRYREVQDAWAKGMEAARANGRDVSAMASVASFFVSRLDTQIDQRLDAMLDGQQITADQHVALRGRAAVANARNAYRQFTHAQSSERWQALAAAGARAQRPLWASTGVKDPAFSPTRYIDELVAPHTVNTMPAATLDAVLADPRPRGVTITDDQAEQDTALFDALSAVGITYEEVVDDLERAGVQAFIDSWSELLELVRQAQSL